MLLRRRRLWEAKTWYFSMAQTIPTMMFWLGATDPVKINQSKEVVAGFLHSFSAFAPVPEATLRTVEKR